MKQDPITDLLEQVRSGAMDASRAAMLLRDHLAQPLGFAVVDHGRASRCGAAEVIFAPGKTPQQLTAIADAVVSRHGAVLVTRANAEQVAALRAHFTNVPVKVGERGGVALIGTPAEPEGTRYVAVVTAGTGDESVAEEAMFTCAAMGQPARRISDVGVAGLHRLGARLEELRGASAIVCIAGMEGALPSVVKGLVDVPVVAVPTSVGYGASFGGVAALLGMLNSCSSGVVVVNIDNGFGAAHAACLINRLVNMEANKARG